MKLLSFWLMLTLINTVAGCGDNRKEKSSSGSVTDSILIEQPGILKDTLIQLQDVDSIEILVLESYPVQIQAKLKGNYSDGCTGYHHHEVQLRDTVFYISLYNARPRNAFCTEALVPFSVNVPLETAGLPSGSYTVKSGNTESGFNLDNPRKD